MKLVLALGSLLVMTAQPRELGKVAFGRDFEAAKAKAASAGKPLLVLFDEVPGCANCTSFGDAVLSDELIVAAADNAFVSVAVYNNHEGADRVVLERFKEPAWNNPVVRILDSDDQDLAPRLADTYAKEALARQMITALEKKQQPVPGYLRALAAEADTFAPVYLSMGCFWSGEACIGELEGVATTRVGYLEGHEVVELHVAHGHDAATVIGKALAKGCAIGAYVSSPDAQAMLAGAGIKVSLTKERFSFSAKDDKHSLRDHILAKAGLSPTQATRVNAAIANGQDPAQWLTPRQASLVRR
jgi:hypothetical protein